MLEALEHSNKHNQVQRGWQSGGDNGTKSPGHLQNSYFSAKILVFDTLLSNKPVKTATFHCISYTSLSQQPLVSS